MAFVNTLTTALGHSMTSGVTQACSSPYSLSLGSLAGLPYLALSVAPQVGTRLLGSAGRFSSLFFFLTRLRIHNDDYCGCPPSVPLLRTEEMESESIEEQSRRLWHFCRH
jgi:hypothetical protein